MEKPNEFEKKREIGMIVEKGMSGQKRSAWKRQLLIAVAAVVIFVPILGFTFPALGQYIPIFGGIFERVDVGGDGRFALIQNYATVVGETQVLDGAVVTLAEAYFDGDQVYLSFLIETDEPQHERGMLFLHGDEQFEIRIDGEEVWPNGRLLGFGTSGRSINEHTQLIVAEFDLSRIDLERAVEIELSGVSLTGWEWDEEGIYTQKLVIAHGPWHFSANVELTEHEREVIHVEQHTSTDDFEVMIHQIEVSPVTMRVDFSHYLPHHLLDYECPFGEDALELAELGELNVGDVAESEVARIEWEVTDQLGNSFDIYEHQYHHSRSDELGQIPGWVLFLTPSPEVTQLIMTPTIVTEQLEVEITEIHLPDRRGMLMGSVRSGFVFDEHVASYERVELPPVVIDLP